MEKSPLATEFLLHFSSLIRKKKIFVMQDQVLLSVQRLNVVSFIPSISLFTHKNCHYCNSLKKISIFHFLRMASKGASFYWDKYLALLLLFQVIT